MLIRFHYTSRREPRLARLLLGLAALALPWHALAQQGTGKINGIVQAQDGTPVPGATVIYGRLAPARARAAAAMLPPMMNIPSAQDGSFSIQNLGAATYLLCVQAPGGVYLDPCHWSSSPPTLVVGAGQTVSGAVLRVSKGNRLPITISDPQQALATNTNGTKTNGTTRVAPLMIGVMAVSGAIIRAELTATTSVGRTYTVTVPFDSPTGVYVASGGFQLVDSGANSVASGGQVIQVTVPSSGTAPSLSFTVTGLGPP
jgi:hypothetical protein